MNYEGFKSKVGSMIRLSSGDKSNSYSSRRRSRRMWSPKKYRKTTDNKMVSHYVSGLVDALQSARLYGFSTHRGARSHAIKMVIAITPNPPSLSALDVAFELRSKYDINVFAIGLYSFDKLDQFTGSPKRVLFARRDQDLTKLLIKLRNMICIDFKQCRLSNFQCLKKYSAGGIPTSYITNCRRVSCDNMNCLTLPCAPDKFCHPHDEHDHYCREKLLPPVQKSPCENVDCDHGTCKAFDNDYICDCEVGWTQSKDGVTCNADVDECNEGVCDQTCTNTDGSYECSCHHGYTNVGENCIDIDECATDNGSCNHLCANSAGSYKCECFAGYLKDQENTQSCVEIDRDNKYIQSHGHHRYISHYIIGRSVLKKLRYQGITFRPTVSRYCSN